MKTANKSYPYPVLGVGDDILPRPSFRVLPIKANKNEYLVHVVIDMDNDDIQRLVDEGYAEFGCEVECSRTFFMKWYGFKTKEFTIPLPKNSVAAKVSFDCRVSVIKGISGYKNHGFHEDYENQAFNLPAGSVLAAFGKFVYDAEIEYDKLHSAGAFLTIVDGNSDMMSYSIECEKIEIKLPSVLYKEYKEKYNRKTSKWADIFHSSLAFNALVYALMSYKEDLHGDLLWTKTLKYRISLEPGLKQYKNVLEDKSGPELLKLAQDLLGNPYKRMFKSIGKIQEKLQLADADYDTGI